MGIALNSTEERRQQEQTRLDSLKTATERNKWGQFATPPALAVSFAVTHIHSWAQVRCVFLTQPSARGHFSRQHCRHLEASTLPLRRESSWTRFLRAAPRAYGKGR